MPDSKEKAEAINAYMGGLVGDFPNGASWLARGLKQLRSQDTANSQDSALEEQWGSKTVAARRARLPQTRYGKKR